MLAGPQWKMRIASSISNEIYIKFTPRFGARSTSNIRSQQAYYISDTALAPRLRYPPSSQTRQDKQEFVTITAAKTSSSSISVRALYDDKVVGTKITSPLTISESLSAKNASDTYPVEALIKNSSGVVADAIWVTDLKSTKNGCADGIDHLERRADRLADAGGSRHGGCGRWRLHQPAPLTQ